MNGFADTLISLLLGWIKTLVKAVYNVFSSDTSGTFWSWLGNNWLGLAVLLCLIGVIIDFAVWIIRWQPYRLWQAKRAKHWGNRAEENRFEKGYNDGVDMGTEPGYFRQPAEQPAVKPVFAPQQGPAPYEYAFPEQQQEPKSAPAARHRRAGRGLFEKIRSTFSDEEEDLSQIMPGSGNAQEHYYEPVYPRKEDE